MAKKVANAQLLAKRSLFIIVEDPVVLTQILVKSQLGLQLGLSSSILQTPKLFTSLSGVKSTASSATLYAKHSGIYEFGIVK